MSNRKKLIEEITANSHALRGKMHVKNILHNDKDGITHSQLFVLAIIHQNQNIGIKEIAKMLNISSSATTQLVDGLARKGYVVRKANSKDRRALHLELSTKGQEHVVDFKKRRLKKMTILFSALNEKDLDTYLTLQKKILSKIK